MDLSIRLGILRDAAQLSEENYNKIIEVIEYFKQKENVILVEENAAMFITHLSAALERISKNELVNQIDSMIFEEIQKDSQYERTVKITNALENITGNMPKEERDFIEMHICTLLNQ